MVERARAGDVDRALAGLGAAVVLCAHRRGRDGVAGWNQRVDGWFTESVDGWRPREPWQPGRAVLATGNDRQLQVFNGDLGVVVATDVGLRVAFHPDAAGLPPVPPVRLERAEPVHAMTIHKSQGSQWDHVVVVLPGEGSRILTRELLYTAATRAARHLTVVGDEAVVRHAVGRPIRRASGLRRRLWDRA
jgi:exodeoxyribonuclease V alpha subunit